MTKWLIIYVLAGTIFTMGVRVFIHWKPKERDFSSPREWNEIECLIFIALWPLILILIPAFRITELIGKKRKLKGIRQEARRLASSQRSWHERVGKVILDLNQKPVFSNATLNLHLTLSIRDIISESAPIFDNYQNLLDALRKHASRTMDFEAHPLTLKNQAKLPPKPYHTFTLAKVRVGSAVDSQCGIKICKGLLFQIREEPQLLVDGFFYGLMRINSSSRSRDGELTLPSSEDAYIREEITWNGYNAYNIGEGKSLLYLRGDLGWIYILLIVETSLLAKQS